MTIDPLDQLLAAAQAHGAESAPEHEVGDLRAILVSIWKRLTPEQAREVYQEHHELIADWLTEA